MHITKRLIFFVCVRFLYLYVSSSSKIVDDKNMVFVRFKNADRQTFKKIDKKGLGWTPYLRQLRSPLQKRRSCKNWMEPLREEHIT